MRYAALSITAKDFPSRRFVRVATKMAEVARGDLLIVELVGVEISWS